MTTLYTYQITLKHNRGIKRITGTGTNKKANINSILLVENCPACAVINIKLIKKEVIE